MNGNELTQAVIGNAIELHRLLGPGLLEGVYEEALCHELALRKVPFERQQRVPILYKNVRLATGLCLDLLVDGRVVVDVKAKESLSPTDKPQLLTYLRLCELRVGLIINFHAVVLRQGISRLVNNYVEGHPPPDDPPDFQASVIHRISFSSPSGLRVSPRPPRLCVEIPRYLPDRARSTSNPICARSSSTSANFLSARKNRRKLTSTSSP